MLEPSVALAEAALVLARRFAHGATLWCWAPAHPHHANHLAVEFLHPVVVGARALPAVAVSDPRVLDLNSRDGDAVVAIGGELPATERLTTIWIGAGSPRPRPPADHVVWLGDDPTALYDGQVVLSYHVLWELTQVCLNA
jgi:hypothetical protein